MTATQYLSLSSIFCYSLEHVLAQRRAPFAGAHTLCSSSSCYGKPSRYLPFGLCLQRPANTNNSDMVELDVDTPYHDGCFCLSGMHRQSGSQCIYMHRMRRLCNLEPESSQLPRERFNNE